MTRTFAVGDIHGEASLLERLLDKLYGLCAPGDTLVFLGDYINRGPDSRRVLDTLLDLRTRWPGPVVMLRGNHEAMLLERLRSRKPDAFQRYLLCMRAYPMVANYSDDFSLVRFAARFAGEHRNLLEGLRSYYEDAHALYVHAGIPAGRHPRQCQEDELLWSEGRDYDFGKPVVYGHRVQPRGRPVDLPDRIGIDTGCGFGGPLTAVLLPERRFVSVRP